MMKRRRSGGDATGQQLIRWNDSVPSATGSPLPSPKTEGPPVAALVQRLPWDFRESFPQPTHEAVENGVIDGADLSPAIVKAIHDEHAREMLATLHDLDAVMDARRRGVDPATGHAPRTPATRERLKKLLAVEPARLEQAYRNLLGCYADAFGLEAAAAFDKAVRARHAGIPVVAEAPNPLPPVTSRDADAARITSRSSVGHPRIVARLPIPRPLTAAVRAGRFGVDEQQRPVRPDPGEVAEITVSHAEKLVDLLGPGTEGAYRSGLAAYAEDFGERPAAQLDAYVRRLARQGERPELPPQRVRGG